MGKRYIDEIIHEYLKNTFPQNIHTKFRLWILSPNDREKKDMALVKEWHNIQSSADESTIEALNQLNTKIKHQELAIRKSYALPTVLRRIAAILLIAIVSSLSVYYITSSSRQKGDFVECFVDNGDRKQITLPDSTKVWINSGSLLVYPKSFESKTRTVFLCGEANFDVAKNKEMPFIVKTNKMNITALGTVFNVKAYAGLSKISASLERGAIKVSKSDDDNAYFVLTPNEQVVLDSKTGYMLREAVDASRLASWKDGSLVFQEAELNDILYAISRKHNVWIKYDNMKYKGRTITIKFSKEETLEQTCEILKEIVGDFNYQIKNNNVTIY